MDKGKNDLGPYLARVRKGLGLSLRTVEAETDVSNAYLSQLETGKIRTPSPTVLHTLALRYEVSYERLMALAGYPVPHSSVDDPPARSLDLAARLGDVSPEEEEALVDFLSLIRKRERGRS
ncbi:helix-turn-helix domain-containing protein [Mesorhizobium atlanticum]|uniref:XRE family transcriptional regulator n=1 Tax=Mesorhizobium atlanticum TaxID=2233532 RepID=A0A330GPI9_9HYPH|nr:helix-turn-helix transcriptional regulator [Mesorhizobium atlanticum]RAZ73064.1 XRE family transcriptional regulator [Mesorhizobium atlanticum]